MKNVIVCLMGFILISLVSLVSAAPVDSIPKKERCPVCGMFVAKYGTWITQIHTDNEKVFMFDGVKDMVIYYHNPSKYSHKGSITEIYVKDYYSQQWIDGRKAHYVMGSDVLGPMGHEFIPFSQEAAALNFKKDHHGMGILQFDEITPDILSTMKNSMHSSGKMTKGKHGN